MTQPRLAISIPTSIYIEYIDEYQSLHLSLEQPIHTYGHRAGGLHYWTVSRIPIGLRRSACDGRLTTEEQTARQRDSQPDSQTDRDNQPLRLPVSDVS